MAIQNVDDLIEAIKQQDTTANAVKELNKVDPVLWGPPTSMEGGDAASRLGIDMGEPSVKAAAMRNFLMAYNQAEKEAAWGAAAVAGGRALATKFAPKLLKGLANKAPAAVAKEVPQSAIRRAGGAAMAGAGNTATVGDLAYQAKQVNRARYARGAGIG